MALCNDITDFMEETAPSALAEVWDNTGLLIGDGGKSIARIMLCLDVTLNIVREAAARDVDLLISHHPLIFKPLSRVIESDLKGKIVTELIRNGLSLYSAHTNLDASRNGVNVTLARTIGLENISDTGNPYLKTGSLKTRLAFSDFTAHLKSVLSAKSIRAAGKIPSDVSRIAVFSGSYDDDLNALKSCEADVLVTGDLKYHTAVDAAGMGLCIIDAGHFNTERIVLGPLAAALSKHFPGIEILIGTAETDPFITY